MTDNQRILSALDLLYKYGQIAGANHKAWVIDQVTRCLLGDDYDAWIEDYEYDWEYNWECGAPPPQEEKE